MDAALPPLPSDLYVRRGSELLLWPRHGGFLRLIASSDSDPWFDLSPDGELIVESIQAFSDRSEGELASGVNLRVIKAGAMSEIIYPGTALAPVDGIVDPAFLNRSELVYVAGTDFAWQDNILDFNQGVFTFDLGTRERRRLAKCRAADPGWLGERPGPNTGSCTAAQGSPDGKWVAAADGVSLLLIDVETAAVTYEIDHVLEAAHREPLTWSPDSRRLLIRASYSEGGRLEVFDTQSGSLSEVPGSAGYMGYESTATWADGGRALIRTSKRGTSPVELLPIDAMTSTVALLTSPTELEFAVVSAHSLPDGLVALVTLGAHPGLEPASGVYRLGNGVELVARLPSLTTYQGALPGSDSVVWSPDGSAFVLDEGNCTIVATSDGAGMWDASEILVDAGLFRWSPPPPALQ